MKITLDMTTRELFEHAYKRTIMDGEDIKLYLNMFVRRYLVECLGYNDNDLSNNATTDLKDVAYWYYQKNYQDVGKLIMQEYMQYKTNWKSKEKHDHIANLIKENKIYVGMTVYELNNVLPSTWVASVQGENKIFRANVRIHGDYYFYSERFTHKQPGHPKILEVWRKVL